MSKILSPHVAPRASPIIMKTSVDGICMREFEGLKYCSIEHVPESSMIYAEGYPRGINSERM
jgi:hypothetical protein